MLLLLPNHTPSVAIYPTDFFTRNAMFLTHQRAGWFKFAMPVGSIDDADCEDKEAEECEEPGIAQRLAQVVGLQLEARPAQAPARPQRQPQQPQAQTRCYLCWAGDRCTLDESKLTTSVYNHDRLRAGQGAALTGQGAGADINKAWIGCPGNQCIELTHHQPDSDDTVARMVWYLPQLCAHLPARLLCTLPQSYAHADTLSFRLIPNLGIRQKGIRLPLVIQGVGGTRLVQWSDLPLDKFEGGPYHRRTFQAH